MSSSSFQLSKRAVSTVYVVPAKIKAAILAATLNLYHFLYLYDVFNLITGFSSSSSKILLTGQFPMYIVGSGHAIGTIYRGGVSSGTDINPGSLGMWQMHSTSGNNTVIRFMPQLKTETNTLDVLGNTTICGILRIGGNFSTSENLSILGAVDVNNLQAKGNTTLCSYLSVGDNTRISGSLSVPYGLDLSSSAPLTIGGVATLCGNLSVHNSSNFYYYNNTGNTTISGYLQVNTLRLSSTLSVINNNDYFQKRVTVQSNAKVCGTLSIGDQAIYMPNNEGKQIVANQTVYSARRSLLWGDRQLVYQYYCLKYTKSTWGFFS